VQTDMQADIDIKTNIDESQIYIYMGLRPSRDQVNQQVLEASKVILDVEILKC